MKTSTNSSGLSEQQRRSAALQQRLDRARAMAARTGGCERLTESVAWYSPAAGKLIEAQVDYNIDGSIDGRHEPARTHISACWQGVSVRLDAPVLLAAVAIPKPWGRELWYTGMEQRGESTVQGATGTLPLPAYLALAPAWTHRRQPIVLLKVLDPRPEPVLGDLYLEVHQRKQEIYLVTAVDPSAWPDGVGAVRYGVNQALRAGYADDAQFRAAYLAAVQAYERVRRTIDAEPVAATAADVELAQLPDAAADRAAALEALERERRTQMDQFTTLRPLRVGDIVTVPAWHPHALQHGVRAIEFQTPTYERYILSFGQQVLTQPHWDSAAAIAAMSLSERSLSARIGDHTDAQDQALQVTRVADFTDFGALRLRLDAAGSSYRVPTGLPYLIAICVRGVLLCGDLRLGAGEAALAPALALEAGLVLRADGTDAHGEMLAIIAAPGL